MSKILVVFGSKSDEHVFKPVIKELKKEGVEAELRISSAHRTPEELDEITNTDANVIIAGAGLSAALPGVIASKTIKPVIGVPVSANYQGLDALLSIMQMPPGIPVMGVGVNKTDVAVKNAIKLTKQYHTINLMSELPSNALKKAEETLQAFDIKYKKSEAVEGDAVNIEFVSLDEPVPEREQLIIYCPLTLDKDVEAEAALNVLKHSTHGLWVGLDNGKNAALAAIEVLNANGAYAEKLLSHRKRQKTKVIQSDQEVKNAE